MSDAAENPLILTKPSDAPVSVALHPLVLLTASDLITRHRVRTEEGPLAGILLGRQNGQYTSAEHAFPVKLIKLDSGEWVADTEWLQPRIQQFKDVHKAPALDVVGWFTTCPNTGPLAQHTHIQRQLNNINDNGIFLAIHPSDLNPSETTNRKLPITTYESVVETEPVMDEGNMQLDNDEGQNIKFREVPYSVETDETEMIAINYVAKGAGSAVAVGGSGQIEEVFAEESKGKQRADGKPEKKAQNTNTKPAQLTDLTTEEEDQIAGITTRLNSVKMLQSRLQLISRFVRSQQPSYASDANIPLSDSAPDVQQLPHLRRVQALLARLALLSPDSGADQPDSTIQNAAQLQRNDVALTTLLSQLGQNVQGLGELGKKFATVDMARSSKSKGKTGFGQAIYGGLDEHDARVAGFTVSSGMLM